MHIFLHAGNGNVLGFTELQIHSEMALDTPAWVQHIALDIKGRDELLSFKSHLEENRNDLTGVAGNGMFHPT